MRQFLVTTLVAVSLDACAVRDADVDPATSDVESAVGLLFSEQFDNLANGSIEGHNGWDGTCRVAGSGDKYLKCDGGRYATNSTIGLQEYGSYILQVDMVPDAFVVDGTHGKLSLVGPKGRVFQIIIGCDNIRVTSQMNGPTAVLATFPCQSVTGPPAFRVVCKWSPAGTVLSCGASVLSQDPTIFENLAIPLRAFDRVEIMTNPLSGASVFDKIYIWRNADSCDLDGDGYLSSENPCGGNDCNDLNPLVYGCTAAGCISTICCKPAASPAFSDIPVCPSLH